MSLPSSVRSAPVIQKKSYRSILDSLTNFANSSPNQKVWSFLNDSGDVVDSYTYKELQNATDAAADELVRVHKLKEGDRAMLVFFPGLAFTASLLACFKVGVIAVPVFPPDPRRLQKDLDHFVSIQKSSGAQYVLTHSAYNHAKKVTDLVRMFQTRKEQTWPALKWIVIDDILHKGKSSVIPTTTSEAFRSKENAENQIAFLQYTSGSTSEPKGVMISHQNLSHNLTLITKELQVDTSTVNVSWLPQYHDMGLIGSYLGTLYCGGTGYFLSPISFLKDPNVWLKCISKYRGSHTQAPNFAYPLAVRKYRELLSHGGTPPAWDLSCVKHMINAAEPVDVKAIQSFYETFCPAGLPANVVIPTYGLAEHTVFVCSDGKNILHLDKASLEGGRAVVVNKQPLSYSPPSSTAVIKGSESDGSIEPQNSEPKSQSQMIVGCGFYEKGESVLVRIVDPTTCVPVEDGSVGEIWVDSPSKALGYWGQPELTADSFQAKLAGESAAERSYLRTGDMGFLLEKELFICGRMKDLIIIRGANHYPQDIERTAEQGCDSLRAGCSAAFAVSHDHTEAVVYVAELKADVDKSKYPSIVSTIQTLISKEHGLSLTSICLLQTKSVIKTTSGKISRAGCKKAFLANTLSLLHKWEGVPDAEPAIHSEYMESSGPDDEQQSSANTGKSPASGAKKADGKLPSYSETEIRTMDVPLLVKLLETTIVNISSQSPSPLSAPLPADRSIVSLGLDSFTIVQFKGVLEKKFYCDVPDEFLFTSAATLTELALAVRNGNGSITPEQKALLESSPSEHEPTTDAATAPGTSSMEVETQSKGTKKTKASKAGNQGKSTVIEQGTPLCPWFVCCY